jgi:putative peptidoglycan lipid II flippase
VGLALGSGLAAWVEWTLLRRALRKRIGPVGASTGALARMFAAALAAAAAGWGIRLLIGGLTGGLHPILDALLIFSAFGLVYFGLAAMLGLDEIRGVLARFEGMKDRFQ